MRIEKCLPNQSWELTSRANEGISNQSGRIKQVRQAHTPRRKGGGVADWLKSKEKKKWWMAAPPWKDKNKK